MIHAVVVEGMPAWAPAAALLGPGAWHETSPGCFETTLETSAAAALGAVLRGVGLGGQTLSVTCVPAVPRAAVRAARLADARARRETTPGFSRAGVRIDDEGRYSLTPEALALDLGRAVPTGEVWDLGCGAGGNTIGFARTGHRVVAVERDAGRLADAQHNARLYGVAPNVRWVHADAATWLASRAPGEGAAAVLFVDPPWGVDWNHARTRLADLPLLAAVLASRAGRAVVAKVPPSFDPATITAPGVRARAVLGLAAGDARRVKFVLVEVPAG
jgi:SAM-dependent methyltransferase